MYPNTDGVYGDPPEFLACPNGPLLVRSAGRITDSEGVEIGGGRRVIALCRCGKSRLAPLCDGSHKRPRSKPE
jgi:CDGSH-type Zn-finger protein